MANLRDQSRVWGSVTEDIAKIKLELLEAGCQTPGDTFYKALDSLQEKAEANQFGALEAWNENV